MVPADRQRLWLSGRQPGVANHNEASEHEPSEKVRNNLPSNFPMPHIFYHPIEGSAMNIKRDSVFFCELRFKNIYIIQGKMLVAVYNLSVIVLGKKRQLFNNEVDWKTPKAKSENVVIDIHTPRGASASAEGPLARPHRTHELHVHLDAPFLKHT